MLRFDADARAAAAAASNDAPPKTDADDADGTWIRWAPLWVPLSGGCVLFMAFVVWSAVL
jgi:hypothetical protein